MMSLNMKESAISQLCDLAIAPLDSTYERVRSLDPKIQAVCQIASFMGNLQLTDGQKDRFSKVLAQSCVRAWESRNEFYFPEAKHIEACNPSSVEAKSEVCFTLSDILKDLHNAGDRDLHQNLISPIVRKIVALSDQSELPVSYVARLSVAWVQCLRSACDREYKKLIAQRVWDFSSGQFEGTSQEKVPFGFLCLAVRSILDNNVVSEDFPLKFTTGEERVGYLDVVQRILSLATAWLARSPGGEDFDWYREALAGNLGTPYSSGEQRNAAEALLRELR